MNDEEIKEKIEQELDKVEGIWKEVAPLMKAEDVHHFNMIEESVMIPSIIPGFKFLEDGKPKVADFIALVLDIRDSTKHLIQAIGHPAKASQLQRILYETTAVNTAGTLIVENHNGAITEFLGDGFLAFFKIENPKEPDECVYAAHKAAKKSISITKNVINKILYERYKLPPLQVGIGLAYSDAIVTIIGSEDNLHAKAIGECVYRASKLSKEGKDEIFADKRMKQIWPKSDGGPLRFRALNNTFGFDAFKIEYK